MTDAMTMTATSLPLPVRPAGIMFHHFHGQGYRVSQGSISADDLRHMLEAVDTSRILPARVWVERAVDGRLRDGDLCLTFDDNLRCQFEIAVPVLREFGLSAFFFVYTSVNEGALERLEIYRYFRHEYFESMDEFYASFFAAVRRTPDATDVRDALSMFQPREYLPGYTYLSDNDKRFRFVRDRVLGRDRYARLMDEMLETHGCVPAQAARNLWMSNAELLQLRSEGHVIGLHSHTHPTLLEALSSEDQTWEYTTNKAYLTRLLCEAPVAVSHPNNSYSSATLELLAGLGIAVGFRANMALSPSSALELPRHNHTIIQRELMGVPS